MSSSVLSNNNCGPVTGLLGNQTFLLQTASQQKTTTIPSPLWRTFYTPPIIEDNNSNGTDASISPTAPQITLTVHSSTSESSSPSFSPSTSLSLSNNNNIVQSPAVNLPSQRMTLQKLQQSVIDNTTLGAVTQKPIMSVSKLVRPTPKSQHPHHQHHNHHHHHQHHHQQHHQHQHQSQPQSQHHQHQQQHQHQHQQQHQHHLQHQLSSSYNAIDVQSGPINLVTNTQSDIVRSRPSSTSSVDIESDDIPEAQQQQQQQQQGVGVVVAGSHAVPTLPAAYQFNYNHLYANKSGYHNAAVVNAAAAAAAADTLRLHSSYPYSAIAAAAAAAVAINVSTASSTNSNIFPMNPMSSSSSSSSSSSATLSHHPHNNSALAPPLPPSLHASSSQSPVTSIVSTSTANTLSRTMDHHHQQQQQQEQKQHHLSVNENMFSPPLSTALPPTALSNGTYINCKSSPPTETDPLTDNYFKVPNSSGKEGSLKHRILTRPPPPPTEKEEKMHRNAIISTHNSTASFKKGSYIELANGVLRRVEDMRTEDFIQCADRSLHLQLAESTVVRIDTTKPQMVIITFSYDRNRSKADIEVSVDHPFFVYGQGWASCDPEKSHKAFGLKCQRLQVGDICISLTQRTTSLPIVKTELINKELTTNTESLRYTTKVELPQQTIESNSIPAMSIKSEMHTAMPPPPSAQAQYQHTPPTGTSTVLMNRVPPSQPMHFIPCHMPGTPISHHQMPYHDFAELVAAAAVYNSSAAHLHHLPTAMPPPPSPDAINGFYQQSQQLFLQGKVTAADLRLQPPPPSPSPANVAHSYCPPRTALLPPPAPQHVSPMLDHIQEQPFDASIASRKRRWSAPEGDCDEVDDPRDHCQNQKLYKTVIAPVTT